ncbi:MAG: response regulator transcription factor, partial [Bacteroidota bacterium]
MSIIIIDDHKLIRESFCMILNNTERYKVVASCGTAEEGIRNAETLAPDIVITDFNMPGMKGTDAIPLIKNVSPKTRFIGISMHSIPAIARKMIKCGALAYVTKKSPIEELFAALEEVTRGKKYI